MAQLLNHAGVCASSLQPSQLRQHAALLCGAQGRAPRAKLSGHRQDHVIATSGRPWSRRSTRCRAGSSPEPPAIQSSLLNSDGPIMVWFKVDLRVDDHEGLIAAVSAATRGGTSARVLPVYVIDPAQLKHLAFIPSGPAVLVGALRELRAALEARGSGLLVVPGRWQDVVPQLVQQHGVRSLVAQHEVEHMLVVPALEVASQCAAGGAAVHWWAAPCWQPDAFKYDYRQWRAGRPPATQPRPAPEAVPALPDGITDTGVIPSADELEAVLAQASLASLSPTAAGGMREEVEGLLEVADHGPDSVLQRRLVESGRDWLQRLAVYLALGTSPASGSSSSSNGDGGAEVAQVLREAVQAKEGPAAEGHSFPFMFAAALSLGAISRRRVYAAAAAAAASSSPASPSSPPALPSSSTNLQVRAAAVTAESADFHWQLAARNGMRPPGLHPGVEQRHWRWNGFLTDYCYAEPPPGRELPGSPALLLVHGFGAMGDQWRDNLEGLAAAGYRVYAPTLPGFGRSEKVAMPYSQFLWGNFIRDFVIQIVGGPVVMAGNSIGGFCTTCMAADHPALVKGLVLINSAGPIQANFSVEAWQKQVAAKKPPPKWLVKAVSGSLFWYLERSVPGTLAWLYVTNPERAKGWLAEEILRASADIGALEVFASVFYLAPPQPLNYLINERYKGNVLVLQGVLDPLNDAKGRAQELVQLCPQHVEFVGLQAGHCPHDEVPELFNAELVKWLKRTLPGASAATPLVSGTSPAVAGRA